jgi:hypothetical protein
MKVLSSLIFLIKDAFVDIERVVKSPDVVNFSLFA